MNGKITYYTSFELFIQVLNIKQVTENVLVSVYFITADVTSGTDTTEKISRMFIQH